VVVCLEQGADLHMAQLMPLPLTDSCFSKIQIGFTFLGLAHLGNPRKRAIKRVCVYVSLEHKCHIECSNILLLPPRLQSAIHSIQLCQSSIRCNAVKYSNKNTHSLITNAKLCHELSVVGRVNLISVHVQLHLQVYVACLQSAIHTTLSLTKTPCVIWHLQGSTTRELFNKKCAKYLTK